MAVQYWVGDFFVDLSRNQVTQKEQSQTIAPKALAVLTCLAENQGRVVSYDELLSAVWPDTVVTPNTLQRSIAQLRKVLGQDSALQSYIKTHAKQGYSLECDVKWHDETNAKSLLEQQPEARPDTIIETVTELSRSDGYQTAEVTKISKANDINETDTTDKAEPAKATFRLIVISIVMLVLLGIGGFNYLNPKQNAQLSFDKLRSLTATDDKEYAAVYSPDGQYTVFHRYIDKVCMNNLWAKNMTTQQETRLTKNIGSYGGHSFSTDGKKLAFISTEDCDKPIPLKPCYNLMSLDFTKALESPQLSTLMVQCKNSQLRDPIWLDDDHIAVLQKFSNRWKLTSYSIKKNKSTILFELTVGNLIAFDYSVSENLIAVTSVHNDGRYYIEMLKPDGQLLSSHAIAFPQEFSKLKFISPTFDPLNKQLVFSSGRQIFTLSYEGKVNRINLPLDFKIENPKFHPDGKKLLLIKKWYDSDIASIPLEQLTKSQLTTSQLTKNQLSQNPLTQSIQPKTPVQSKPIQSNISATYSVLERSTAGEDNALFQPGGELISFVSERSGEDQLWVTKGNGLQIISTFPSNTFIRGYDWAADGNSVLVNANGTLTQIFLDSQQKKVPFEYPVLRLFQWDSENNTALLRIYTEGVSKFAELNLNNLEFRVINNKINWAQKSEDGRLIYTDRLNRFWQPGPAEDQLIELLDGQGSSKRFVIKDNVIYGINKENRLWVYDLNKSTFNVLKELGEEVDYLTDINQTHALIELRITAKKEVVELTLSE